LIKKGSGKNDWGINLDDVLENWKSGCIIRTELLNDLPALVSVLDNKPNKEFDRLLDITPITSKLILKANIGSIATPCMSASLNWILSTFSKSLPTNLIQAQRDYFGSHSVELVDSPENGFIHIDWE
jgi:6-phosphogluconate dehydrogenase